MPEPKKRHSKGRKNRRRSHLSLSTIQLAKCINCTAAVKPHAVCPVCGFYKGKKILEKPQRAIVM
ncbi:MAG: 50S ribosomal protein L32 [Patescibacteria group bacterium]